MKRTIFQHPTILDENGNVVQQGTYGKESSLVNSTNDGVLDYINNNLEALHDNINGSRIYVASKAALPATGDLSAMYIAEDTGKWYLWDGNKYIETDNARKIADEAIAARDAAKASANDAANSAREQQADWNVTDTTSKAFIKNKPAVYGTSRTLEIGDTRNQIDTPSSFMANYNKRIKADFKHEDVPGASTFSSFITIVPWGDSSGGYPSQLAFTSGGKLFYRIGMSDEKWGDWKRITLADETIARATSDASGNVITTTYARKDNASITNLTVSGETSVPTANAGNSSKAIANTEFVAKSISALVNGAPDQLNTLNELAKALGNDSNFAATVTAELAKKLNSAEAESTYATKQEVQGELTNYLPLSGGTLKGAINTANLTWNKLGNDASFGDHNIGGKMCVKSQHTLSNTGIAFFNHSDTNVGEVDVNNAFDFNKPVKENGGFLVPIGIVQAFAGTTIPKGWLLCDGSAVSRTTYAKLFAVIGTTYGTGDKSTTFNLPNLVDKFVEGSATAGKVKSAGLPNITGSFSKTGKIGILDNASGSFSGNASRRNSVMATNEQYDGVITQISFDASRSSSVYGNSTTVQPPALTMWYIIKY